MEVKRDEWTGIQNKYFDIVLNCFKNNLNARIPNPDINHAKFLTYLLLKKATRTVRIFSGCLKNELYEDPKIKEALYSLKNIKIEIITECEPESILDSPNITIRKVDLNDKVKKIPGHFIVVDGNSYRYEKYHPVKDISHIEGTANANDVEIAHAMEDVFDNVLKVSSH